MLRTILFLIIACFVIIPAYAQGNETCVASGSPASLELAEDWYTDTAWTDNLTLRVVDYLNTGGTVENLTPLIEKSNPDIITSTTFVIDVTNDSSQDIILMTVLWWGGRYEFQLAVYRCEDEAYHWLDDVQFGDFGYGVTVELIADTNNNQLPEIILRPTYTPRKYYESLDFYEWDGEELELIFQTGWQYGGYGDLLFTNYDDDPMTAELIIERSYSYGEATVLGYIELWLHRPVDMVYTWTGETYTLFCQYFTDRPTILYQVVHSAEAFRQCGRYQSALAMYQNIVDDYHAYYNNSPEFAAASGDVGPAFALDPALMGDMNSADFERDYITAFAYYRMLQIHLYTGETQRADTVIETLHSRFPIGKRGYRYAAMAEALYTEFISSGDMDAACELAETAFNAVRDTDADPPIPYYINDEGEETTWTLPFYHESGKAYSSNPDNIFAVPDDVANIVFIPVCLQ